MNMLKSFMMVALVVISNLVSAQRGNESAWLQVGEKNFTNWIDAADKAKAAAVFAKYVDMPFEKRLKSLEEVSGTFKFISLGKWEGNGVAQRDEQNIGVKMYVMDLAKEFKNKSYGDRVVPMYAFESGKSAMDYNQMLVLSIDNNLNGVMDDLMRDPKTGKLGVRDNTSGRQPIPMVDLMTLVEEEQGGASSSQQGGGGTGNGTTKKSASLDAPGSIVEDEDGQQYKVTYDEDGNKTYRLLSNAGDGNVQKKKASRTETVEVVGDQNLLAQRGGAQQDGGQLPPGVVELKRSKDYYQYNENGMLVLITKPKSGPTVMDPGNGVILNSDEQVVETDKRTRRMMVRRYFDASGNPTPASIVDAGRRNGFWNNNGGGGCGSCGSFNCGGGCQTGLPMVMNGGCGGCGGGMTVVGTTLINRHDPVQTAMFKQNALNASAASKQIWMQQNSYLYGGRR